jgi:ribosome-binding ATPase YchF (GTP1/OBG family)
MPNSNTNDFNLNDDQIERLAEAIVEKLFIKQEEADAKFLADLETSNSKADIYIVNNDGSALSELEQQIKLLEQEFEVALKKELYNTAADLDLKLKMLKKQRDENKTPMRLNYNFVIMLYVPVLPSSLRIVSKTNLIQVTQTTLLSG